MRGAGRQWHELCVREGVQNTVKQNIKQNPNLKNVTPLEINKHGIMNTVHKGVSGDGKDCSKCCGGRQWHLQSSQKQPQCKRQRPSDAENAPPSKLALIMSHSRSSDGTRNGKESHGKEKSH